MFNLQRFALGISPPVQGKTPEDAITSLPQNLVYGAFSEYEDIAWSPELRAGLEAGTYLQCVAKFCTMLATTGRRAMVILPPEDQAFCDPIAATGVTRARVEAFNRAWKVTAAGCANVTLLRVGVASGWSDVLAGPGEIANTLHFRPSLLMKISARIASWLDEPQPGDPTNSAPAVVAPTPRPVATTR